MREIKFRAWDNSNKVFVKGMLCFEYDDFDWVLLNDNYEQILWNYNGVLSQYTGLKDKNGVEIYEGDILAKVFDDYDKPCIVSYEEGILSAHPIGGNYYRPLNTRKCKTSCHWCVADGYNYDFRVIGNIYEHPHLLGDE